MGLFADIIAIMLRDWAHKGSRPSTVFANTKPPPPTAEQPFLIPQKLLTEHAAIFAPSGHGKTQALQHLFCHFLYDYDHMSYWIIDSQGDMLKTISQFDLFDPDDGPLKDHIIIIDPEDPNPPALNLFHLGGEDAMTDDLFMYIFTAIDNSLTPQQSTTVTFLLRLMRVIPGATINTLRQVLDDKSKTLATSPFAEHIRKLDDIAQAFFESHFFAQGPMQITRSSISRRLFALLANDTFRRMFAAPVNAFDPLQALQDKKIVLINTSQKSLGDGSAVLGRFFIAQALSAAYRRPEGRRDAALLIVDEASEYFDYKTERILSTARKFGLGMMAASQFLDQLDVEVKASIFGNTAIKMAGPVSHGDATKLAQEMYTDTDFIRSMKKHSGGTEFACYVRSVTNRAIKVNIPFGTAERHPKMPSEQYVKMRQANRLKYGTPETIPPKPTVHPHEMTVTLIDYGIAHPCVLDSGAYMTTIPATDLRIENGIASFTLLGIPISAPVIRMRTLSGFTGETQTCPVISLKIKIGAHEAPEECALNLPGTTLLIGRTFMAGRILVDPKDKPW